MNVYGRWHEFLVKRWCKDSTGEGRAGFLVNDSGVGLFVSSDTEVGA
jgi:hypothetical protein